jgi:parallel beta-helix repeat protein
VINSTISGGGTDLQVGSCTTIFDNSLLGYSGVGILVSGTGSRIEGNVISGKDVGLQIDGTGNAVFKNIAHGNTTKNYEIAAGNEVGPIGTMASSTSPWANAAD